MDQLSRRKLFAAGGGVAAGLAITAIPGTKGKQAGAADVEADAAMTPEHFGAADGVVVVVRDAAKGDIVILGDGTEANVTDRRLAAAIGKAARRPGSV